MENGGQPCCESPPVLYFVPSNVLSFHIPCPERWRECVCRCWGKVKIEVHALLVGFRCQVSVCVPAAQERRDKIKGIDWVLARNNHGIKHGRWIPDANARMYGKNVLTENEQERLGRDDDYLAELVCILSDPHLNYTAPDPDFHYELECQTPYIR